MITVEKLREMHEARINKCLGNYGPDPDSHPGFLHLDHMKAAYEESKDMIRFLDHIQKVENMLTEAASGYE